LAHLATEKEGRKKGDEDRRKREREKGIKATRNPPAISVHPIGRPLEGLRGLGRSKEEGQRVWQRKSLLSTDSPPSMMRHIDFIFIPDRQAALLPFSVPYRVPHPSSSIEFSEQVPFEEGFHPRRFSDRSFG